MATFAPLVSLLFSLCSHSSASILRLKKKKVFLNFKSLLVSALSMFPGEKNGNKNHCSDVTPFNHFPAPGVE